MAGHLRLRFWMGIVELLIVGIGLIALLIYLVLVYFPQGVDVSVYVFVFLFGCVCAFIFLFYGPHRIRKAARDSEYMVTNQRVFFEALAEYAFEEYANKMGNPRSIKVMNLEDIEEVYVKRGVHDRIFGTSTLYVRWQGFQCWTRHQDAEGEVIMLHKPPSFPLIKEAQQVGMIIQEAARKVQQKSQTIFPTSTSPPLSQNGFPTAGYVKKQSWVRLHGWLMLSFFLMLSAFLVFVYQIFFPNAPYVSYENGYSYINYAGILATVMWILGGVLLFLEFGS